MNTTATPGTELLAYTIGGPLAKIAQDPTPYVDPRYPARADDLDATALVVRKHPEHNNEEDVAKLLNLFTWHRQRSISFINELIEDHGLERVSLAFDILFDTGEHAHRSAEDLAEVDPIRFKRYDPNARIQELLELLGTIEDISPDFELSAEALMDLVERGDLHGLDDLIDLERGDLFTLLQPLGDADPADFPSTIQLRDSRDREINPISGHDLLAELDDADLDPADARDLRRKQTRAYQ